MTLRNAFGNLVTETVANAVQTALERLAANSDRQVRQSQPMQTVPYARAVDDSMRVTVVGGGIGATSIYWGNGAVYPTYFGTGAYNSIDSREMEREAMNANAIASRNSRWRFT